VDCGSSSVAVEEQWAAMQRSHPWLAFDGKRLWPAVVLAGWLLLGLSTLLTRRSWWGLDVNFFAFVAMVSCIFLAIAQYAQHHGMVDRENQPQHGCLIVFGMVVLGIMLSLGCPPGAANVNWAPPLGACMAGAGWVASWYSRKAGGELYAKVRATEGGPRLKLLVL
jgi:cobalamin synthase